MFESVRPVAPPSAGATDDELDRIERTFDCHLPADYRAFMKILGPGTLNGYVDILSPDRVIAETVEMRDIYKEEMGPETAGVAPPPYNLFFFHIFDNAAASFQPADIDRFICIATTSVGDAHFILPDDPPRYFEVPRDSWEIAEAGTTIEEWLDYLDPRTRYQPQARRVVEQGVVHEDDGRPDGTLYVHTFTPEGYAPADPRPCVERAIVWGHTDDPRVTHSLRYGYDRLPDTTLELIHADMARYPLFVLLDAIAQRDPTTRFEMVAQETPEAELKVPRFEATLRAAAGHHGLTLHIRVPQEHARPLVQWLADEISALGAESPPGLLRLVSE
jgi:hypothetical protein